MVLIILLVFAYIFAGIGYYRTCKERLDSLKIKRWEYYLLFIVTIFGWIIWLPMFGFAYVMTEIEFWIKKKIN